MDLTDAKTHREQAAVDIAVLVAASLVLAADAAHFLVVRIAGHEHGDEGLVMRGVKIPCGFGLLYPRCGLGESGVLGILLILMAVPHAVGIPDLVLEHGSVVLGGVDDELLPVGVDAAFLGRDKAGAHDDTVSAESHCGNKGVPVAYTAASDNGDGELFLCDGDESHGGHISETGMACALEADYRDGVGACLLSGEGVSDGGALMDELDLVMLVISAVFLLPAAQQLIVGLGGCCRRSL